MKKTQKELSQKLFDALNKNDSNMVKYLINVGAEVNSKNEVGDTPLHLASDKGNLELVKFLISNGADVIIENNEGDTPLRKIASKRGISDVMIHLINSGADVNVILKDGDTLLNHQIKRGNVEGVKFLITHGADVSVNSENEDGDTPLNIASRYGYLEIVKILEKEMKILKEAKKLLFEGLTKGDLNKVKEGLRIVKDVNNIYEDGWTPLHIASKVGKLEVVKYLITLGANVSIKNKYGEETPLHIASKVGKLEVVKYLITLGANVSIKNKYGETPLHIASYNGHLDIVKYLISVGANVNSKNKDGWAPLHLASYNGHLDIVKYLITIGANVNIQNNGVTPLDLALQEKHSEVVKILEKYMKIFEEAKDLLFSGAEKGDLNKVKEGVRIVKDVNIQNSHGWTPLHYASDFKRLDVVKYLITLGADVNIQEKHNSSTPLHFAIWNKDFEVVKYLVDHGADIGIENRWGKTPPYVPLNDENRRMILNYIADRLFKIIFMLSNNLQRKSFGLLPLEEIITSYMRESDIEFLKDYANKYIFDGETYGEYNADNIIAIIISIATQEEYMDKRIIKEADVPEDFIETVKEYITRKF